MGSDCSDMVQWLRGALRNYSLCGVPTVHIGTHCGLVASSDVLFLNAENVGEIPALKATGKPFEVYFASEKQRTAAEEGAVVCGKPELVAGKDPKTFVEEVARLLEQRRCSN